MRWVTRERVKLDRTACAWLILRFIDPAATLEYLPSAAIPDAVAAGARPFHEYPWGGPGSDRADFPRLLDEYHLAERDPALVLLGHAVQQGERMGRAQDGSDLYSLWGIVNGLTALHPGDDAAIVQALLPVYDALYAACRQRAGEPAGSP